LLARKILREKFILASESALFRVVSMTLAEQILSLSAYLIRASLWLLIVLVAGIVWPLVAAGCGLVRISEKEFVRSLLQC
jgi:hypothetical protein